MKTYDGGIVIILAVGAIALAVGLVSARFKGDDNIVEETIEIHMEDYIERQFGLEEDTLKDIIDITPWSTEESAATIEVHRSKPGLF